MKKLLTRPRLKIVLLTSLIIVVVSLATVGGIAIYFTVGNLRINFEQNLNDIDPQDMGVEEYIEDFEYMYSLMEANFPFFDAKERRLGFNWLDLKEEYLERIGDCENNAEFLNVMVDAIQSLQNCHTYLVPPSYTSTQRGYFVEDNRYPFYEIFSEEAVEANQYWIDIYNDVMYERDNWFLGVNRENYDLLMVYDRGEYVVHEVWNSTDEYLLDSKVVAVGGVPIHDLIKESYKATFLHFDFARSRNHVEFLRPLYLNFSTEFTFQNTTGDPLNATLSYDSTFNYPSINWRGYYPELSPLTTRRYVSDKVGYLQIGGMMNPTPSYHSQIMSFYESIEDYDHLIIDIRGNTGGSDRFWVQEIVEPLLKEKTKSMTYWPVHNDASYSHIFRKERQVFFKASKSRFDQLPPEFQSDEVKIYRNPHKYRPKNSVDFDGEITVLIDKLIYSSAESFSVFCRNTGFAKLYGTNTGGDGIGDATYFTLPNSKLIFRFSYIMGLFSNGEANEEIHTPPDVYYESAAGNWSELIDFTIKELTS